MRENRSVTWYDGKNITCRAYTFTCKVKGKICPTTRHEGPEGMYKHSSDRFLTSAPDAGGWSKPRHSFFSPWKRDPMSIIQEAGWSPGPVWTGAQNFAPPPPPGFDLRTVQHVASLYADYAIPAHISSYVLIKSYFMFYGNYLENCKTYVGSWQQIYVERPSYWPTLKVAKILISNNILHFKYSGLWEQIL
jgi:hypothetical protein